MGDLLRMDYINSLPQPFMVRMFGREWWWPVYDIDAETGVMRIDVMGKLDVMHFGEVAEITDIDGTKYDPNTWYNEDEDESETPT